MKVTEVVPKCQENAKSPKERPQKVISSHNPRAGLLTVAKPEEDAAEVGQNEVLACFLRREELFSKSLVGREHRHHHRIKSSWLDLIIPMS